MRPATAFNGKEIRWMEGSRTCMDQFTTCTDKCRVNGEIRPLQSRLPNDLTVQLTLVDDGKSRGIPLQLLEGVQ
jgi:hypothetical protein